MDEYGNLVFEQPDYSKEAKKSFWGVKHAVNLITRYYLREKKYKAEEEGGKEFVNHSKNVIDLLKLSIKSNLVAINIREYDEYYDENGLNSELNIEKSKITPVSFIIWAIGNGLDIPEGFIRALPYYKADGAILAESEQANVAAVDTWTEDEAEDTDFMYPVYKGMELEELTKEKFDEIKKHYGMLQKEVAKLTRTVQITAEIGLLFYDKGLEKPSTASAFKEAFNINFAGIPMRLVQVIYDALPEDYKSYGGNLKDKEFIDDDTMDIIIEASVSAGYICKKDVVKDVKSLREILVGECEIPPNIYLNSIVAACKRIAKN